MIFYIYLGYPLIVIFVSMLKQKKIAKGFYQPSVTILTAAFNEERHIEKTVRNKLEIDYPAEKMQIIVISDGSTDRTDAIVQNIADKRVTLVRQAPRAGKTSALNLGATLATGEILIFSDANSIYDKNALNMLLRNFHDPSVGYVTGQMIYINPDGSPVGSGCSAYMKYENMLRRYETELNSIVGVDGGIDAVRKSLYKPMRADQLPDFVLPLNVIEQGYRVVYEKDALLGEVSLTSSEDEYRMRVRVALRALWALWDFKRLFNVFTYKAFSWQLFSHKVLRYLAILFLFGLFLSCAVLSRNSSFYTAAMISQIAFYAMATASLFAQQLTRKVKLLFIPYYFTLINVASGHSLLKFLMGKKQVIWTPRKG